MRGSHVKYVRTNKSGGSYTVEFTKDYECYKKGDQLCMMPYELIRTFE